jgi:ferredoxin
LIKRFEVITPVLEADGVFNLCKLKTHVFMHMTGAVKNLFGVIPGLTKPGYHAKLHDRGWFASMLLDLADYIAPRLSIMDAVMSLEGEGPGAKGEPRHVGLLIAARSPLALDVVASEIIGLKRVQNPVLIEAENRGLYPTRLEEVELIGADIAALRIPDYKFPATVTEGAGLGALNWLNPWIKSGTTLKPRVIKELCIACGACRDSCPVQAITIDDSDNNYAQIDDDTCIRCYCCHEMCPESAVELHQGLLHRVINRL